MIQNLSMKHKNNYELIFSYSLSDNDVLIYNMIWDGFDFTTQFGSILQHDLDRFYNMIWIDFTTWVGSILQHDLDRFYDTI